ncbi:MAG: hypothetical protein ACI4ML_04255 [Aristaeellaceae bacterium]
MSDYKRNPRGARRARKSLSRKALVVLSMMMVLVFAAVGGTLAWLVATTEPVTNTFSVGDINITLTETWNADSDDEDLINDHWEGKVVPGGSDDKDPTVTVLEGSEKCYVYVTVENNLLIDGATVATVNIDTTKWAVVGTTGNKTLYRYIGTTDHVVDAMNADVKLPVFTQVNYSEDITKSKITQLNNPTIVIQAYAHQSENTNEAKADDEAKKWAGITTTP